MTKGAGGVESKATVVIVGCGVIGLTSGIRLLEEARGKLEVIVIAEGITPNTTSDIAAAFWMPSTNAEVSKLYEQCARTGYERLWSMYEQGLGGVRKVHITQLFADEGFGSVLDPSSLSKPNKSTEDTEHTGAPFFHTFVKDYKELKPTKGQKLPYSLTETDHGFTFTTLIIETPIAMKWLMARFTSLGGKIIQRKLASFYDIGEVLKNTKVDLIINCTGLGSWLISNDKLIYPLRGQVAILHSPSTPRDHIICYDAEDQLTYIVPRLDGVLVGGTAIAHDWDREIRPQTTKDILSRSDKLVPGLGSAPVIKELVGLRPARSELRLEMEPATTLLPPVIHNYGHGGSGWSLSWGCAEEVLRLASAALNIESTTVASRL